MILVIVAAVRSSNNVMENEAFNKSLTLKTVAFIGSGNVAHHFIPFFQKAGFNISGISSRNHETGQQLAQQYNISFLPKTEDLRADLMVVCVKDQSVEETISKIHASVPCIVYTAGSIELNAFEDKRVAVFYPLQTFSKQRALKVSDVPILIESRNTPIFELLTSVAKQIGFPSYHCDSAARKKVHLSAVFLNNFTHHLVYLAQNQAINNELNWEMFLPLLKETVNKWQENDLKSIQTGPARRGDLNILSHHLQQLEGMNKALYALLTESIQKTYLHEEL
jgi:predicted short-subunit dehydrogenase-like oxidoreductase (DUF2520 family)